MTTAPASASSEWRAYWTLALAAAAGFSLHSIATNSIGLFMEPRSLRLELLTQSPPRLNCSTAYSLARIERARIVRVGLTQPLETKQLPSTTNRFLMS